MPNLKLILWNMEWLNDLFVCDTQAAQFRPDNEKTQHSPDSTVKQRRDDLSGAICELNPDVVVALEGPSRPEEMQLFFDNIGQGTWASELQVSPGQSQNIGVAVRVDTGKFKQPTIKRWDTKANPCFDPFLIDTDNDDIKEQHYFERRPLYIEISPAQGAPFRVLGLHLKSKLVFSTAYEWSEWREIADANRKKILAQAAHIHNKFIVPYLTDDQTRQIPLIVCGDINDGPGLDASKKRLFGRGVERLMGNTWQPDLCLGNALFDALKPKDKKELDFSSIYTTHYRDPIFDNVYQLDWIDHILYSKCQIANWVRTAQVNYMGQVHHYMPDKSPIWKKYKHASDHLPVSVEVVVT
jgi:endonuclease/exonuclease/phosphatase family metal-dependent hydrolase